jgi:hypothetical protein
MEFLPKPGYIPKPRSDTDYVKNVNSPLGAVGLFQGFDLRGVRPVLDLQNKLGIETSGCVSWTACQCIEEWLNGLIRLQLMPQSNLQWLLDNNYIVNGLVVVSKVFIWIESGTTQNGNDFTSVGDAIRKYGLIPESMLPFNPQASDTWTSLRNQTISQACLDMGQEFLKRFDVGYYYVNGSNWGAELPDGPIQIAIPVCPGYNTSDPIQACGLPEEHSVMIDYMNGNEPQIVDHYAPEIKDLASNYPIMASMQWVVTPKQVTNNPMQLVQTPDKTVYILSGVTNKAIIGIADGATLALFGDEPIVQIASLPVPQSYTIGQGFVMNKK